MSREIKFRVYCKKHTRWDFYTLGDLVCGATTTSAEEGGPFENWCQFTGLKDKNGKEIYEGDIVRYFDWCYCAERTEGPGPGIISHPFENAYGEKSIDHYKPLVGVVRWNQESVTYEPLIDDPDYHMESFAKVIHKNAYKDKNYPDSIYEVIGNIYENPELVK